MSIELEPVSDNVLRLLCIKGLGARTLTELVRRAGDYEHVCEAVLAGDTDTWLPRGGGKLLKKKWNE